MAKDQLAKTIGGNIVCPSASWYSFSIQAGARRKKIPGVLTLLLAAQALHVSTDALLYKDGKFPYESNILAMLHDQSEASVKRIERIVRVLLQEYP